MTSIDEIGEGLYGDMRMFVRNGLDLDSGTTEECVELLASPRLRWDSMSRNRCIRWTDPLPFH
ncbi:MAG: hypothetical protein ACYCTV_11540 [Leptospirales bacterium]